MMSPQEIKMAYRLILGREPESATVVEEQRRRFQNLEELREGFLGSAEFRSHNFRPVTPEIDHGPPLSVDLEPDPSVLPDILQRVEQCWRSLGETEPFWSVASCDQFKSTAFMAHATEFYETGRRDIDRLLSWLVRNHVDPATISSCSEYGCGVGRVTAWLAARFPRVYAYDISAPHLKLAREYLGKEGQSNVVLHKIDTISSLSSLEHVDLVFTVIVLQHNPPPVIALLLRMLLRSLNPRGVAYFQVPTYALGYDFDARSYLRTAPSASSFEMHLLPQSQIFRIVRDAGCAVLEMQPDFYVGSPNWVSNTFLVQRV
jgi:SAM-dependent methyltransferase